MPQIDRDSTFIEQMSKDRKKETNRDYERSSQTMKYMGIYMLRE